MTFRSACCTLAFLAATNGAVADVPVPPAPDNALNIPAPSGNFPIEPTPAGAIDPRSRPVPSYEQTPLSLPPAPSQFAPVETIPPAPPAAPTRSIAPTPVYEQPHVQYEYPSYGSSYPSMSGMQYGTTNSAFPLGPATVWDHPPVSVGPSTAGGLHQRYPYYSYRRPWYTPGPASLNVTIIW